MLAIVFRKLLVRGSRLRVGGRSICQLELYSVFANGHSSLFFCNLVSDAYTGLLDYACDE